MASQVATVAVIVGVTYLAWYELAKRNPQFQMGAAGESTIILAVVAISLIFVANPIAISVALMLVPNYRTLEVVEGPSLNLTNSGIAALFLVFVLILLGLLVFRILRLKPK